MSFLFSKKEKVREELKEYGITHATLELEAEGEPCHAVCCHVKHSASKHHHHHYKSKPPVEPVACTAPIRCNYRQCP